MKLPMFPHECSEVLLAQFPILDYSQNFFLRSASASFSARNKCKRGPGSSVGIATGYGLDDSEIESLSGFGGLGVCVLASGTQGCGFAPDRSRRIFRNGKIHSTQYDRTRMDNWTHRTRKRTNRAKKTGVGKIFRTCPDRPWVQPSLLYIGYRVFPGGRMPPGRDDTPHPLLVPKSKKTE
jgi:hypothetical protein